MKLLDILPETMYESALFLIEGGRALMLLHEHLREVRQAEDAALALAQEIGAARRMENGLTGVLMAVDFAAQAHPEFERGECGYVPRAGTEWDRRFRAQKGYRSPSQVIREAFGVPASLTYRPSELAEGKLVSFSFADCGFLYGEEGAPFALYVPNIASQVKAYEARGYIVDEPARSFAMSFEGCRRIEWVEYDQILEQHCEYEVA